MLSYILFIYLLGYFDCFEQIDQLAKENTSEKQNFLYNLESKSCTTIEFIQFLLCCLEIVTTFRFKGVFPPVFKTKPAS